MAFRYSAVCPTLKWMGYSVAEDPVRVLTAAKSAGYDGADLPVELGDPGEIRGIVDDLGLEVPEIMGTWGYVHSGEDRDLSSPDEKARERGIAYSRRAIDLAVELDAQFFNVCVSQPPVPEVPFPVAPIPTLRQNFGESLRRVCEYAGDHGVSVLLEPLNQYEAIPGLLTTVHDAIRVIDELGLDNLGVQPDVFHMNVAEASIPHAIQAAGSRSKVIHMNETNHYRLGTGHADFKAIYRTLRECAFDGYVSVYMPYTSQETFRKQAQAADRPDLETVMAQQLRFLKEIESAVDAESAVYDV